MPDPAQFQQSFGAALAAPTGLIADPALTRALTIHRNTSTKAAMEALSDNYPVVRQICGDEAFAACALAFIVHSPPRDPRLCLYGQEFDRFIDAYAPFVALPYLADLARLEQLHIETLFAADAEAMDAGAAARGLDLARPLALHPATRFAAFDHPAAILWLAHQPDAPETALDQIDWRPGAALVTRPDLTVQVLDIDWATLAFLQACAEDRPLAEAAAEAVQAGGDLPALFSTLITAGAFALAPHRTAS